MSSRRRRRVLNTLLLLSCRWISGFAATHPVRRDRSAWDTRWLSRALTVASTASSSKGVAVRCGGMQSRVGRIMREKSPEVPSETPADNGDRRRTDDMACGSGRGYSSGWRCYQATEVTELRAPPPITVRAPVILYASPSAGCKKNGTGYPPAPLRTDRQACALLASLPPQKLGFGF